MLQQVTKTAPKYYQLALFNIGLIIALCKELSPLHIIFSLAFIVALTAPIAKYFGIINDQNIKIVHEEIEVKLKNLCSSIMSCLKSVNEGDESKRIKLTICALLFTYCSINFLCPCLQAFIFFNALFIYLFLQEEVEKMQYMLCNACEGCCSSAQ